MPTLPEVKIEPVTVPEPQPLPEQPEQPEQPPVVVSESTAPVKAPSQPITPSPQAQAPVQAQPKPQATVQTPAAAAKPATPVATAPAPAPSKIDVNGLPVSWSIQLASLSSRAGAENLQRPCAARATTPTSARPAA